MTQCTGENRQPSSQSGVSIAICCYNSARRLPETLRHLAAQRVDPSIPWEVLIIDNASTDNTSQVALREWTRTDVPLRVLPEPTPGLANARVRAVFSAGFEYIGFIDDDNWVAPDWVGIAFELMRDHPDVAVCQSCSVGAFDTAVPEWFDKFKGAFAITPQYQEFGDITRGPHIPWGAGMVIRRSAWLGLWELGFRPILPGRRGGSLTCGEDTELCIALRCVGWKWWCEPRLRLQHFIEQRRVKWKYLRLLYRGFGGSTVLLELYQSAESNPRPRGVLDWLRESWPWRFYYFLRYRCRFNWRLIPAVFCSMEGDKKALDYEALLGEFLGLLDLRRQTRRDLAQVRTFLHKAREMGSRPTPCP